MASTDNVNIDVDASQVPLQAGINAQLLSPIVVRTVGTIASIAGLFGPDILFAAGGATIGLSIVISPVGNTITFSLSGAPTALRESSGPTTLNVGAVANGEVLKRVGATLVGLAIPKTTVAAVPPTVNDDNTAGYSIFSLWLDNTGPQTYICRSATTGAADWAKID